MGPTLPTMVMLVLVAAEGGWLWNDWRMHGSHTAATERLFGGGQTDDTPAFQAAISAPTGVRAVPADTQLLQHVEKLRQEEEELKRTKEAFRKLDRALKKFERASDQLERDIAELHRDNEILSRYRCYRVEGLPALDDSSLK